MRLAYIQAGGNTHLLDDQIFLRPERSHDVDILVGKLLDKAVSFYHIFGCRLRMPHVKSGEIRFFLK
jgi:hypothetical protein